MSLFITGTGTNVGKTVVTAGLASCLHHAGKTVCVYKPVQTGSPNPESPEDPTSIKQWAGTDIPSFCSYVFPEPVAPYAADHERLINPKQFLADFQRLQSQYQHVLVEGAGGVRVPVAPGFEMIDLIRMLQLPTLIVTAPQLGTINHTLLTVESLQHRQINVKGVILSGMPKPSPDPAIQSLISTLEPFLSVPLLATLPVFELSPGCFAQEKNLAVFEELAGLLETNCPTAIHT